MTASRTIHALVAHLGLPDETYRTMLWDRYQAASSKDLTDVQANDLVAALHSQLPDAIRRQHPRPQIAFGTRRRFEDLGDREDMATPAQLRMLEAAWVQRSKAPTLAAKQVAFREFVRRRFSREFPRWIERADVGRIMTAIGGVDPDAPTRPHKPRGRHHSNPLQPTIKGA